MMVLTCKFFLLVVTTKACPRYTLRLTLHYAVPAYMYHSPGTIVVKWIYNLTAISTFTCGVHDHLYNQFIL